MEIININEQPLDTFVSSQKHSQFLQSWNWGEFQKSVGHQVWRFGVTDNGKIIASAQIIGHRLPLKKSYLYCPRGPIVDEKLTDEQKTEALKLILSKARSLTIQTSQSEEIFFRFEPTSALRVTRYALRVTRPIQPADTLILNLQSDTDKLLSNMHPKTRYNIHLAEKHGVTVKQGEPDDFKKIWPLFKQTKVRDKFNLHPQNYYQTMLKSGVELWVALNKNGRIIAANLISFFGDTATYLHGASDYNFRQLMAPHLLQWEVIKEARERGFKYYDFHGIAPENKLEIKNLKFKIKQHPWAGVTRFKKGFGGREIHYPGTFDFIYEQNWYKMYKLLRTINFLIKKI